MSKLSHVSGIIDERKADNDEDGEDGANGGYGGKRSVRSSAVQDSDSD